MAENVYYIVFEITEALDATRKAKFKNVLHTFGKGNDPQPYKITHGRPSLNGQKILMVVTLNNGSEKKDFVDALADELGIPRGQINAKCNFTKLAGATTEERAQAARDYIVANKAEWEPAE